MTRMCAALLMVVSLGLAGCSTNAETGAVVGAVTGGLIGNTIGRGNGRVVATAAGAVIGGIVGNAIGERLDEADRRMAADAEFEALERGRTGEAVRWRNPDSGHYGEVTPRRAYRRGDFDCREYEHRVFIDGEPEVLVGQACRNPDGTWSNVG